MRKEKLYKVKIGILGMVEEWRSGSVLEDLSFLLYNSHST